MGHKTDLRQVSRNSPRRLPPKEPKPITSRTGPRQQLAKRIVPLQHNLGDPIVIARPPAEFRRQMRKMAKKARLKAASGLFNHQEHEEHEAIKDEGPAISDERSSPIPHPSSLIPHPSL